MYVLMRDGEIADTPTAAMANAVATLEEAFASICCRSGLSYRVMAGEGVWLLELTMWRTQSEAQTRSFPLTSAGKMLMPI